MLHASEPSRLNVVDTVIPIQEWIHFAAGS